MRGMMWVRVLGIELTTRRRSVSQPPLAFPGISFNFLVRHRWGKKTKSQSHHSFRLWYKKNPSLFRTTALCFSHVVRLTEAASQMNPGNLFPWSWICYDTFPVLPWPVCDSKVNPILPAVMTVHALPRFKAPYRKMLGKELMKCI